MRLTDLDPSWRTLDGTPSVLKFDCPKCRTHCFRVEPNKGWTFSGTDFNTLTVYPSIDARSPGNDPCQAHFSIINGEIIWN